MKLIYKLFLVTIILVFVFSCRIQRPVICGNGFFEINPKFRLENFGSFINNKTGKPEDIISIDTNKIYSPDNSYYFDLSNKNKMGFLYDKEGNLISKYTGITKFNDVVWLNDCAIFENEDITLVNLKTGRITHHKHNKLFLFIGQDNNKAFYASYYDYNKIDGIKIVSRFSIVSISSKELKVELDNKSYGGRYLEKREGRLKWFWQYYSKDTVNLFQYFNSNVVMRSSKLGNVSDDEPFKKELLVNGVSQMNLVEIPFYDISENTYSFNDTTYLNISLKIYRITKTSFNEIIDLTRNSSIGQITKFKVSGDYLIFKSLNENRDINNLIDKVDSSSKNNNLETVNGLKTKPFPMRYEEIGVINLKTGEVTYPQIKYNQSISKE